MLRAVILAACLFAATPSAEARCCHRARPLVGAPARLMQRVAERKPVRRLIAAPFRLIRGGHHAACH
jgi:hypothetical protein